MIIKNDSFKYSSKLKQLLDAKEAEFNKTDFIVNDPISIPHQFTHLQDIEIMGLFAATLAWGQRKTIINKCQLLVDMMGGTPHDFVLNHQEEDLKPFLHFKHRTFNATDVLYFMAFLKNYYTNHTSLETAFAQHLKPTDEHVGNALIGFHNTFFSLPDYPTRTRKHLATPERKSACKRLNMFLRWMVRCDNNEVDFGLWKKIKPAQLLCPLDVHVDRVARRYGLISRKQTDWKTVVELTNRLKLFDAHDPVKYDFALFGIGVLEKNKVN